MKSRLRILHVMLSRGFAGTERSTVESCNSQCENHDVAIVIRRDQAKSETANIRIHLDPRVCVLEVPSFWRTLSSLRKIISDWQPDVIHAHLRRSTRLVSKCDTKAVKISTLHIGVNSEHFLEMDALIAISPWQLEQIPSNFKGIVKWIRNSLISHPKPNKAKIAALRKELSADSNTYLIGGVGRLSKSKGWDVLINAFKIANIENARLVIIGDGSEKKNLLKIAQGNPNITFLGFRNNIKDYYSAFDVFVCPSREEPMGRVILEALDARVRVIASNIEGPRDILSEYPGTLFPAEDAATLARELKLHALPRDIPEFNLAPHFIENVSKQMTELYRDAISRKNQIRC